MLAHYGFVLIVGIYSVRSSLTFIITTSCLVVDWTVTCNDILIIMGWNGVNKAGSGEVVKQVFLSASVHHMDCVCGWVSFTMSNNCSSFMVIADCIIMIYSFITATLSIMQILSVQPQTKSSPLGPEEACGWIWSSFYNVNRYSKVWWDESAMVK